MYFRKLMTKLVVGLLATTALWNLYWRHYKQGVANKKNNHQNKKLADVFDS
jgi:hypothetical protein